MRGRFRIDLLFWFSVSHLHLSYFYLLSYSSRSLVHMCFGEPHAIMSYGFRMDFGLGPEGSLPQFPVTSLLASCFLSLHFPVSPRQKVSSKKVESKNMGPFLFQLPFIAVSRKGPTPATVFKL